MMSLPSQDEWKTPLSKSILDLNEVHVWRVRLDGMDGDDDRLWRLLSEEECNRANRFFFDQHRYRFLRSHAILREILARYLERSPQELRFAAGQLGKPFLEYPSDLNLQFNLSHSGDLLIVGVALGREIGVDVEVFSPNLDWKQIAAPYFHSNELVFIEGLHGEEERLTHFYRIWVMKEAYLKARGKGLSGGLDRVEVNNTDWQSPAFIQLPDEIDQKHRWQVFSFKPATGACGTVVVENCPEPVTRFSLLNWSKPG